MRKKRTLKDKQEKIKIERVDAKLFLISNGTLRSKINSSPWAKKWAADADKLGWEKDPKRIIDLSIDLQIVLQEAINLELPKVKLEVRPYIVFLGKALVSAKIDPEGNGIHCFLDFPKGEPPIGFAKPTLETKAKARNRVNSALRENGFPFFVFA